MKIEIDLDNIFRDEDGNPEESLQESIRRQVISKMEGDLRKRLFQRMDEQLSEIMKDQIGKVMTERMPSLIDDIMNVEFTPVTRYGEKQGPTTFRTEIIKSVAGNMKYEPRNSSYEENAFTKAVKSIVEHQTDVMKKELTKQVDEQFKRDALSHAVKLLSDRLGLPKVGQC